MVRWLSFLLVAAALLLVFSIIFFIFLLFHGRFGVGETSKGIKLVVLVDNNEYARGVETAWGLSIYVEAYGSRILFDTGPSPDVLRRNAERLGIDLNSINFIVISHEHGDHTGGLSLFAGKGLAVYIPRGSLIKNEIEEMGLKPVEVSRTIEVAKNIYVTKPLYGPPWEEAMAIATRKGLIIVVGCSHPGVAKIVKQACKDIGMRPYIVIGGFHMAYAPMDEVVKTVEELLAMGVSKIYPLHCSGDGVRSYLAKSHPENYGDGGAGLEIKEDI